MSTPIRSVRVSDQLWQAARKLADKEETSVSEVINQALKDFTKK